MSRRMQSKPERGFALLLVFLLAAAVALMLYRQLPRTAFENEREKEQVLIDRGEQYKRAIQLFRNANARWPQSIEELEKFADKRYLRRRYKDPMTGKDEWRLIHTNGAFLTDSLVTKPPNADGKDQDGKQLAANSANPGTPGIPGAEQPPEVNAAVLQRPSDRVFNQPQSGFPGGGQGFDPNSQMNSPAPFDPNAPIGLYTGQQNQAGQQPGFNPQGFNPQFPPITLAPGATPSTPQTGVGQTGAYPPGSPGAVQPGQIQPNPGFNPQFPGQQFPGQQFPGQPAGGQGFVPQFPGQQFPGQQPLPGQIPGLPGVPGQIQPGQIQPGQVQPGQVQPGQVQPGQVAPGQQYRIDANGQFVPIIPGQQTGNTQPGAQPQYPGQAPGSLGQNPAFPQFQAGRGGAAPPVQPGQGGVANPAINLINQLLTTPRQPAGTNTGLPGGITPGQTGIAGVASTSTAASIKRYKEKSKYSEWEFVYEMQQAIPGQLGQQNGGGQPGAPGQPGNPGQPSPLGQPITPIFPLGGPAAGPQPQK
jgi:type II secretory pathway pseudopilin PulG